MQRFIVAVDYGTTYTKVAFAQKGNTSQQPIIGYIQNWPEGSGDGYLPSRVAYDGTVVRWGHEAKPGMMVSAWTKLLLEPERMGEAMREDIRAAEESHGIFHIPRGKEPTDIVKAFLSKVYGHLETTLPQEIGKAWQDLAIDFVFAYPTIWAPQTCQSFDQITRDAGFGRRSQDRLFFLKEAEAAAYMALKQREQDTVNQRALSPGDGLLVVDAGGGTIDMAVYEIAAGSQGHSVRQICAQRGANCGSTAIDGKLYTLLSGWFNKFADIPSVEKAPGSALSGRVENLKKYFKGTEAIWRLGLDIKDARHLTDRYDDRSKDVKLSNKVLREQVFDPVVEHIKTVLASQMNEASRRTNNRVGFRKLILARGFSLSPYLRRRLEEAAGPGLQVGVIDKPQLAVVSGAVLRGLDGFLVPTTRFPRSYGFHCYRQERQGDPQGCISIDPVNRGEEKLSDYTFVDTTTWAHDDSQSRKKIIYIYSCNSITPPTSIDHETIPYLRHPATIEVDFTGIDLDSSFVSVLRNGRPLYKLECEIEVSIAQMPDTWQFVVRTPDGTVLGDAIYQLPRA